MRDGLNEADEDQAVTTAQHIVGAHGCFDMLSATGSLANGTNQIAANVNLSLPGIASVTLMATIGERPVGTSWVTVGSAGATVHTAQTRILLVR